MNLSFKLLWLDRTVILRRQAHPYLGDSCAHRSCSSKDTASDVATLTDPRALSAHPEMTQAADTGFTGGLEYS